MRQLLQTLPTLLEYLKSNLYHQITRRIILPLQLSFNQILNLRENLTFDMIIRISESIFRRKVI